MSYGSEYKKGQAEAVGFYRTKKEDATNIVNEDGWKSRHELCKESGSFELIGRPHGEIFNQERYLMPGIDVRIAFHRAPSTFCLERHGSDLTFSPKLVVLDSVLYVQKVSLLTSLHLDHLRRWDKSPCIYPGQVGIDVRIAFHRAPSTFCLEIIITCNSETTTQHVINEMIKMIKTQKNV